MLLRWLLVLIFLSQILARDFWVKPGCYVRGNTRTINIYDCLPFNVTTNGCIGYCESLLLPSTMVGFKRQPFTSYGKCCHIEENEDVHVKAVCSERNRDYIFKSAVSCSCYVCQKE